MTMSPQNMLWMCFEITQWCSAEESLVYHLPIPVKCIVQKQERNNESAQGSTMDTEGLNNGCSCFLHYLLLGQQLICYKAVLTQYFNPLPHFLPVTWQDSGLSSMPWEINFSQSALCSKCRFTEVNWALPKARKTSHYLVKSLDKSEEVDWSTMYVLLCSKATAYKRFRLV